MPSPSLRNWAFAAVLCWSAGARADPPAPIAVHGRSAFELTTALAGTPAAERARAASLILGRVVEEHGAAAKVSVTPLPGEEAMLRVGDKDLLRLGPGDAAASGLPPTVYYESLRASVETYVAREHRRARLQAGVLAVSMAVFLGLLGLLVLRWLPRRADQTRAWVEKRAATWRGLRIKDMQVVSPEALESIIYMVVGGGTLLARIGIVYLYLVYTFAQFEATRSWGGHLTNILLTPVDAVFTRLGVALPAALLLVAGVYMVRGGLRIVGLFLDHVSSGKLRSALVPGDMAAATRPLARVALVLVALLALGPIASGASDGMIARIGLIALGTLALGGVPVIASMAAGAFAIFGRRYELGQWVEIGTHVGEVTEVNFLDLCLVPVGAGRVRVPHLVSLFLPVRHLSGPPAVEVDLPVSANAAPAEVIAALERAMKPLGAATVRLHALSAAAAAYRVRLDGAHPDARAEMLMKAHAALLEAGIALGSQDGDGAARARG